jgi:hypothetical protein
LPATDNYVLNFYVKRGDTGNLTVSLFDNPPDVTGTVTIDGAATHVTASQAFQNVALTFSGTSGQVLVLTATAPNASSANLTIIDPNNNSIFATGIGSFNTLVKLSPLPTTGTYTVFVNEASFNFGSPIIGDINVQLSNLPADATASVTPGGGAVQITTTLPFQAAAFTFTGSANQQVSGTLIVVSGINSGNLSLLKPDGSALVGPLSFGSGGQIISTVTLPVPGTYTIRAVPSNSNTGKLKLTLTSP